VFVDDEEKKLEKYNKTALSSHAKAAVESQKVTSIQMNDSLFAYLRI